MIHKRQTDLFNPADHADRHVTIVGLGNIGSHTAIALAKMGISRFTLYDFDEVEAHNTASQAFVPAQCGATKVDCLAETIIDIHPDIEVECITEAFRGHETVPDILIIAVDSMHERKNICAKLQEGDSNPFIIDGRMGGGQVEVWAQRLNDWSNTFSDNPDTDACSARYISYTSYVIAGIITNTVKRYIQRERLCKRFVMHLDTYDVISQYYDTE